MSYLELHVCLFNFQLSTLFQSGVQIENSIILDCHVTYTVA